MKHISYIICIILASTFVCACNRQSVKEDSPSPNEVGTKSVLSLSDTTWKSLSLREKIGQLMLMLPDRKKELQLGDGSLSGFFEKYPVTGFFMGWKLWDGVQRNQYLDHIRKTCAEYQQASKLPLIFQEDYESGVTLPGMTSFPNEMALGAANSPKLAYQYGKTVAQ